MPTLHLFTSIREMDNYFRTIPKKLRNAKAERAWDIAVETLEKFGQVKFGWSYGHPSDSPNVRVAAPCHSGEKVICWDSIPIHLVKVVKTTKRDRATKLMIEKVQQTGRIISAAADILEAHETDKRNAKNGTPTEGAKNVRKMVESALGVKFPSYSRMRRELEKFLGKLETTLV